MKVKVFRPSLDDVERLSYGKAARKRGTGSKYVCHRLNQEERKLYELAKNAGYLSVRGTAYRKERKGSPLCNTFRQRCDALEELCIILEKRAQGDKLLIDFSTLRVSDDTPHVRLILENVIERLYPKLLENTENLSQSCTINRDKLRTESIWNINERLITIECDRDIAKSLAGDILKESCRFHKVIPDDACDSKSVEIMRDLTSEVPGRNVSEEVDNDSIDWDDL